MTAAEASRKPAGLPVQWAVVAAMRPKKSDHVSVRWFEFPFTLADRLPLFAGVLATESDAAAAATFIFVFRRPIELPAVVRVNAAARRRTHSSMRSNMASSGVSTEAELTFCATVILPERGEAPQRIEESKMLGWALTFLVVALIAAVLGFGGIAGLSMEIAKIIFFVAIVLFLISAVIGVVRGRSTTAP